MSNKTFQRKLCTMCKTFNYHKCPFKTLFFLQVLPGYMAFNKHIRDYENQSKK